MSINIANEVAAMERMTVRELREQYEEVFHEACRSNHKTWLIKRIAWRLQANEEGDISARARLRAAELANDADLRMKAPPVQKQNPVTSPTRMVNGRISTAHDRRIPMPGTELIREYKGETLRVMVLSEGFEFQGEKFQSLSAVAKFITGSHTSGFLFFRLQ